MRLYPVRFSPQALDDLADMWQLIASADGSDRANAVVARVETYCISIGSMPHIGTAHEEHMLSLRTVPVRTVKKATIVFHVKTEAVTILRISYLGKVVIEDLPSLNVDNPIDVTPSK